MSAYTTLQEADTYFLTRLLSQRWFTYPTMDREAALLAASDQIDRLNFIGLKHAAWVQAQATPNTNDQNRKAILDAGLTQARQFPRGTDETVPDDIKKATYEIAYLLLDGKDPDMEYENLMTVSEGYSSVRRTYNRVPSQEHLVAGIVSPLAWRYLKPYLRDGSNVKLRRV